MTPPAKEISRILSRSGSLRVALLDSGLSRNWELADLENMADAATMLWDQANDAVVKHPEFRFELSESISRLFELLLSWSSRFDLWTRLARARSVAPAFHVSSHDAQLSLFEALAFQGRFHDTQAWQREQTFYAAQRVFAQLPETQELWTPIERARTAHAWFLIGLDGVSCQLLLETGTADAALSYFTTHPAPANWRAAHISSTWINLLHGLATSPRQH